jgi:hypothetical protein
VAGVREEIPGESEKTHHTADFTENELMTFHLLMQYMTLIRDESKLQLDEVTLKPRFQPGFFKYFRTRVE